MINTTLFFIRKNKIQPIVDVVWFSVLLLGFHFLWRYWEQTYHFRFFTDENIFRPVYDILTFWVFNVSDVVLSVIIGREHYYSNHLTWYFENGGYIAIIDGCSGLKASFQFIVIILFFQGPWKHKIWYIPLGLFILFLSNIVRIVGLSLVVFHYNSYFAFAHDYLFRPFFYGMIFLLWIVWVERFKNRKKHLTQN